MNKKRIIFLTGSTGLVGSYLLKDLIENGNRVYAVARGDSLGNAKERVLKLLRFWDSNLPEEKLRNLIVVDGDITKPNLGINSERILGEIRSEVEIIFHSAALAKFRVDLDSIRIINVDGTRNVLDFALNLKRIRKINYISTAYVIGNKGLFSFEERMLSEGQNFNNSYEQSKYEAEVLVQKYQNKSFSISTFRPSMIVGETRSGKITSFRMFYEPLRFFSREIFKEFPADLELSQNLVNIDSVSRILMLLGDSNESRVYHIVSPKPVSQRIFVEAIPKIFNFSLPEFIPLKRFNFSSWTKVQSELAAPFVPYCNYETGFLSNETQKVLNSLNFSYPDFNKEDILILLKYCLDQRFIKNKIA